MKGNEAHNMDRPLLTPAPNRTQMTDESEKDNDEDYYYNGNGGDGESHCPGRVWAWFASKWPGTEHQQEYNHAHTVMMLKNVMTNLSLAMESVEEQRIKKLNEIRQMLGTVTTLPSQSTREMARRALQTAKQYEQQRVMWFHMRENVESLKAELMAQQQSLTVFKAFNRANRVMETIASHLNLATLEKTLSVLQDNLDSGKEISQLLSSATPLSAEAAYDPDELDRELDMLSSSSVVATFQPRAEAIVEKGKEEAKGGTSPLPSQPLSAKKESRKEAPLSY